MNNKKNKKIARTNIILVSGIIFVLMLSFLLSWIIYINTDFNMYDNEIRVLLSHQNTNLEQGKYDEYKYPYMIIDLSGKVIFSDEEFNYSVGDVVNVQEAIKTDKYFAYSHKGYIKESFALYKENSVNSFAIYLIPKKDLAGSDINSSILMCFLPIIFGSFFVIVVIIIWTKLWANRILNPIQEISTSAKKIILGNYDYEVVRVYGKTLNNSEVGNLIYSFELMRDELKNKQISEENLKKSQQELISCISHDLMTPISTIKAYAEGIRDGIAVDDISREKFVNIIINKTNLLINMISDLLTFSNAQLNHLEITKKETYFKKYFINVMEELHIFAANRDVELDYNLVFEDMIVNIDENRITEVLYNLVENSIKYCKEDGLIKIIADRNGDKVLIRVIDNGIGINASDIPYVFDKFYRAEKSRSSSIPGSGLGLAICKYIVEQHNGEIYCKSFKDSGCEIGFTIG